MIKSSTVIKRMIKAAWKPIAFGLGITIIVNVVAGLTEKYAGIPFNTTYWGLFIFILIGLGLKTFYEITQSKIEFEQKEMMRDLERKHL